MGVSTTGGPLTIEEFLKMKKARSDIIEHSRLQCSLDGRFEDEYRPQLLRTPHDQITAEFVLQGKAMMRRFRSNALNRKNAELQRENCSNQQSPYEGIKLDVTEEFFKNYGIISFLDD